MYFWSIGVGVVVGRECWERVSARIGECEKCVFRV